MTNRRPKLIFKQYDCGNALIKPSSDSIYENFAHKRDTETSQKCHNLNERYWSIRTQIKQFKRLHFTNDSQALLIKKRKADITLDFFP